MEATGLPGRPRMRASPSAPWTRGLPGRIAIFQKSSDMPCRARAGRSRSRSPTDAPPSVTRIVGARLAGEADAAFEFGEIVAEDAEVDDFGAGVFGDGGDAARLFAREMICVRPARARPARTSSSPLKR